MLPQHGILVASDTLEIRKFEVEEPVGFMAARFNLQTEFFWSLTDCPLVSS